MFFAWFVHHERHKKFRGLIVYEFIFKITFKSYIPREIKIPDIFSEQK